MVVLAVLARLVPEMDILFISLPLRLGLGLLMVAAFLPLIGTFLSEFAELMGKLVPV
jgi:flagellar biosynthesis protein FliR